MDKAKQHVFLVGAKSLGAYGGYETFVNKLTEYHQNNEHLMYHVACKANGDGCMDEGTLVGVKVLSNTEFSYHNARCFKIRVPRIGPAQAIYYDIVALRQSIHYIKKHKLKKPIVYIMACRIGPFFNHYYKQIHRLGGKVYVNPDGHEWKRAKWNAIIRKYWKYSEYLMIKHCDLVVCDSLTIEKYIHDSYDNRCRMKKNGLKNPLTTYIAYGAETRKSKLTNQDEVLTRWYSDKGLKPKEYYLVVGRFVPENNYETMIREFMGSATRKDFAIITNVNDKFLDELENRLHFRQDERIKFVGTVYDQELLMKIRENAYGYFHGHEVGGTNPSLLEAMGSTDLNLLLKVGFNEEVAMDSALYWTKEVGNMAELIAYCDNMPEDEIIDYGHKSTKRIEDAFSWQFICDEYEKVFLATE